jgi:hypothetical protein
MIRIEISAAAYDALAASTSRGLLDVQRSPQGSYFIWLPQTTLNRLRAARGASQSYSDAILRLASEVAT